MSPQSNYGSGEASEDVKHPPISKPQNGLVKTEVSFVEDLKQFAEGTVPQSIIVALVIGTFEASSILFSRPKSKDNKWALKFCHYFSPAFTHWTCFISLRDRNCMRDCCQHLLQNSLWSNGTYLA